MKTRSLFFLLYLGILAVTGAEELPLFTWDLLWTLSYSNAVKAEDSPDAEEIISGGTLYNRGDLSLGIPRLDLHLRFLATDKRLMPPEENDGKAGFNPGFGLYHNGSSSRFLYGVQSEYGLPARINNVWLRGIPFMESRSPSSRDLKIEPAAKDRPESYLYLGLPDSVLPGFDAFASAALDADYNPSFGAGLGFSFSKTLARLEGFYTQKKLPPRGASTWFSASPPLPERDFDIYALGAIFNTDKFAFATDWAYSETFAWGQGVYGNAALRLGNKPWRFSLAGDGAGPRFSDRSGSTSGGGLRLAARGEHFWPRSGLLRFQGSLRKEGLEESFNRGALSFYFRPSAPSAAEKRNKPNAIRFSRASLSVNRDTRKPEKTLESLNLLAAFNLGPVASSFSLAPHWVSCLDPDDGSILAQPAFESMDSYKISGELGYKPPIRFGVLDLKARLGYTARAEKESIWELSLNASLKPAKWGRISVKIASPDFPAKWEYSLGYRLEYGGKFN